MTTPDLLEAIVAATRREVAVRERQRGRKELEHDAAAATPRADAFCAALRSIDRINVIAECKRRSPSRGVLRAVCEPGPISAGYAAAGAAAVSVLTEPAFFDGTLEDLVAVRGAVELPLLRKDFLVTEYQVVEARAAGADAVLLIVAALDDRQLTRLITAAHERGLASLVEVHDGPELDRGLAAGAQIIGVNNRNLRTLEVDLEASHRLIEQIPASVIAVAESGLRTSDDLVTLRRGGYDAFLIGETLMTQPNPGHALRTLLDEVGPIARGDRQVGTRPVRAG